MKIKLENINQIGYGESIFLAPAGGASERFHEMLVKHRKDIDLICYLDSYKSSCLGDDGIKRIDEVVPEDIGYKVVVVIERESIVDTIASSLSDVGFKDIYWIDNRFRFSDCLVGPIKYPRMLHFFYDFGVNALNYEFLIALAHADAERNRLGLQDLHVVLVPQNKHAIFNLSRDSFRDEGALLESDNDWFLHNVIVPSIALLPSCKGFTLCGTRGEAGNIVSRNQLIMHPSSYNPDSPMELDSVRNCNNTDIYDGKGYGQPFYSSKAAILFVKQWIDGVGVERGKIVAITLRQNKLSKERNSNLDAWKCFAGKILKSGYVPVFIKDTYTDFDVDTLDEYKVFHVGAWNIMLRMALYELSYLNMTVNTGTIALCMFNERVRYINFIYLSEDDYAGSVEFHNVSGNPVGTHYPGSTPYQKTVWGGGDDCMRLIDEFDNMVSLIED